MAPTTTTPASDPGNDDAGEDALDDDDDSGNVPEPPLDDPDPSDDDGDDDGDGGEDGGVELPDDDDGVDPQQSGPCDALVPDGSSLVVGPDPLILEDSVYEGSISIVNCSDGDIDWTAATKPSVTLDDDGANLLPGETAELDFVIDKDAWDPGAIDFKIKVSEPGHNHYVDVHAFRQLTGADVTADVGLSGGEGAGGCANQCIVSALLKPNLSTPNMGLDITTNTEATIRSYVSTQAPDEEDGHPVFPGVEPMDVSPVGVTSHLAHLSPLEPATKYYIIVSATDVNENTSYRSGSFVTLTPMDGPGGFDTGGEEPGCSNDCITKALLTPGDHTSRHLSVESHTPALFQAFVSTEAPSYDEDGVPSFTDAEVWVNSGLNSATTWETDIVGLHADTDYHIIVQAVDANGNVDRRAGQFHTPQAPEYEVVYAFMGLNVDYDGDAGINRGELAFGWRVGDDQIGYHGEHKHNEGDWIAFADDQSYYIRDDITGWLPTVYVNATERDADGLGRVLHGRARHRRRPRQCRQLRRRLERRLERARHARLDQQLPAVRRDRLRRRRPRAALPDPHHRRRSTRRISRVHRLRRSHRQRLNTTRQGRHAQSHRSCVPALAIWGRTRECTMIDHRTDRELVAAHLSGDRAALAAIYDRYADPLYDTAAAMLGDRHEAEDLTHDVFVVASRKLVQLREPERLKAWLFAVLRHEVYRRSGKRSKVRATDLTAAGMPEMSATHDPNSEGAEIERAELANFVREAAGGLGERDQLLLELSARQGLTGADLADAIGVSQQQCHVLLHRMRERVQRSIGALTVARYGRNDCPDLQALLSTWNGVFDELTRKRIAGHVDDCEICGETSRKWAVVPLFSAAPALAAPLSLRDRVLAEHRRRRTRRVVDRVPLRQGERLPGRRRPRPQAGRPDRDGDRPARAVRRHVARDRR